tara:strand:- start:4061 stop:5047 length:987 start_codon:yes stop_codon:yes gene_type:complete
MGRLKAIVEGAELGAGKLAKIVEDALPLDYASRMARAKEGKFSDDNVYRGLYGEYNPDKSGSYQMFTSSPQDAGEYGNNVIQSKIRRGNNLEVQGGGKNFNDIYVGGLPSDVFDKLHPSIKESLTARTDDIAHAAKEAGYDSVTIKDIYDKADNETPIKPKASSDKGDRDILAELGIDPDDPILDGWESSVSQNVDIPRDYSTSNVDIVFDPSNIRSVNAAFDPAKRSSSNLLASAAPAAVGLGALYAPEQNAAMAGQLVSSGVEDYGSITPDEYPMLHRAGDFLEQYSDTPIGPMLGGTADYLRNFGTERNNWQRYKDAVGAYMDFM